MSPPLRAQLATELRRLVRRWVLVFTDGESNHLWRDALTCAGLEYVRTCYWNKLGATPQLTGDRPADHVEHIIVCHQRHANGKPKRKRWNGGGRGNLYSTPIVRGSCREARVHTTQKPLALMEALVRDFTEPGDLIGDPFAGSGTTLVAAKRLGRAALGIEANPLFASVAEKRLDMTRVQPSSSPVAIRARALRTCQGGVQCRLGA